jgi:hypothetical protein
MDIGAGRKCTSLPTVNGKRCFTGLEALHDRSLLGFSRVAFGDNGVCLLTRDRDNLVGFANDQIALLYQI